MNADKSLIERYLAGIKRGLSRANSRETQRQAVRVSNAALRMAQARRIKRQPGLTDEQRDIAMTRVFSRVGGGK